MIHPSNPSHIHEISKFTDEYIFLGEITKNPIDLSQKILKMDYYLFHTEK